jgi:hypothetical protein
VLPDHALGCVGQVFLQIVPYSDEEDTRLQ